MPGPEWVLSHFPDTGIRFGYAAKPSRNYQDAPGVQDGRFCMAPSFLGHAQIYLTLTAPEVPSMNVAETLDRPGLASHLRGS